MHGPPPIPAPPARQRSQGRVALRVGGAAAASRVVGLAESGPSRLRFPRGPDLETVLINTAGGVACGDRFSVSVDLDAGAALTFTTTAAEKIYRSDGEMAVLDVVLSLEAGADLAWLPQETILYDGARLDRRLSVDLAPDARLLLFEAVVLGRTARGERLRAGRLADTWRLRRGGRLVLAEALRLEGDIAARLDRPAVAAGAGALATLVLAAPDAEGQLDRARDLLADAPCETGVSAWNGLLVARFLAPDGARLRRAAVPLIEGLRGRAMPRVWQA